MREKILTILVIALSFIGGAVVYRYAFDGGNGTNITTINKTPVSNGVIQCKNEMTIDETGISAAVGKIYDAAVTIQNYKNNRIASSGSGFIYKKEGKYAYVMTNHHVVSGADKIIITLSDDTQIEGEVLGSDQYLDLASVKISSENVKQVATIGCSENVNLGDTVFTVGTPIGYEYRGTITRGTFSGKNRMVSVDVSNTEDWIMKVIQVDAAINPGNSGGPLVNVNGEVIGINSLKLVKDEIEGMGFAIPIEDAMKYIDVLEKGKKIERPLIGITMLNVDQTFQLIQQGIRIDADIDEGVVVISVSDDSAAAKAGLKKGDIILQIGGAKVKTAAYLKYELYKYNIGDTVEITYMRDNKAYTAKLKLTKAS